MNRARLWTVCKLDLFHYLKRPLFWIWLLIVVLCVFGLASGGLTIQAGDSSTGGKQAHITSAYANAFELAILGALLYTFFVAVAAGMELIRDRELRLEALLHSTPMRPSEYVWGKFGAALAVSLGILGVQVFLSAAFKHGLTAESQPEIVGAFSLANYLQPALLLTVPLIVFTAGVAFAIGERWRRPVLVNLFPLAILLASLFWFWMFTPAWMSASVDRLLMLLDPTGFRWLNGTFLEEDRGADFYNTQLVGFDAAFVLSRVALVAIGLGSVFASQKHLARSMRGERVRAADRERALAAAGDGGPRALERREPLADLGMRSKRPGFVSAVLQTARAELKILRTHPGVWLFLPLIVLNAIGESLFSVGAFDTPLLTTPGRSAVGSLAELTFTLLLFLMVFTVEGLRREESTQMAKITYSTPISTRALVLGKLLATTLVGLVPMFAVFVVCAIVILVQGKVSLDPTPYALVYGLLLLPVVLLWNTFMAVVFALTRNRFATYALGIGAMIGTGLQLAFGNMSWTWNWALVGAVRWTDLGPFEMDARPLLLNRLVALTAALLFLVLAVRVFPRRQWDPTRILMRLRPLALAWTGARLSPLILAPIILGFWLQRGVNAGPDGVRMEKVQKNYWRKNLRTWLDSPVPDIVDAEISVELQPRDGWLESTGTFTLENPHDEPLEFIALTGAPHWGELSWTLDGEGFAPRDDEHLFVFELPRPLERGARHTVGWSFQGRLREGFSKNGATAEEFILESGVVLTNFSPSFAPVVGYMEGVGVDDDNRYDSKEYADDFFEGETRPAFGPSVPHPVSVTVTVPEDYRANGVGVLVEDTTADGRRTMRWESDEPIRFFNIVAGRWDVREGDGAAIYYHPAHTYNIDEMLQALEGARRWYSEWFHPFPWEELRISEFASYAGYAQGFPTNITFSESIGFLTEDDEAFYPPFTVTAHEAAHQWWGNILMPGRGPGGNLLAEGTSHFSTILLVGQMKGLEHRIEFCKRLEEFYNERRVADSERELVKVDGTKDGDQTLTYDKMGWAVWMLHNHLGSETSIRGLRAFFERYATSRDHPVIQDYLLHMRGYADDTAAYDAFVHQWFFEIVLPEYAIRDARFEEGEVRFTVENLGTGTMPVVVAAERGERFPDTGDDDASENPEDPYQEARTTVTLAGGESIDVAIPCAFEPERLVVDPDALVLQLGRKRALHTF